MKIKVYNWWHFR